MVALLFAITVINYLDRQSLSILAPLMQHDLRLSDPQYAHIVTAFLVAYTAGYFVAGGVSDVLGSKLSTFVFVAWWSLAEMVPALTAGSLGLGSARALLGLGEAGIWVAGPKVVGEWFEKKDRATVIGIYTAGATIGATLAPPIVLTLAARHGWRSVFLLSGGIGLLWLVPWWLLPRASASSAPAQDGPLTEHSLGSAYAQVLQKKTTWLLLTARLLTDPVWYFFLFWYPKFLVTQRHQSLGAIARVAWVVYLAADAGTLLGGLSSGGLMRRGMASLRSRKTVMVAAALLLPLSPIIAFANYMALSYAVACTVAFAHMAWLVTLTAMIVDQYPHRLVGTAAGLIAAGSGLGGVLSTELLGHWLQAHSYSAVFLVIGLLHPLALLFVLRVRSSVPDGDT